MKKDIVQRALATFFQAFISTVAVQVTMVDFSSDKVAIRAALQAVAISAGAAGLSAVYNALVKPWLANIKAGSVFEDTPSDDFITEDENK